MTDDLTRTDKQGLKVAAKQAIEIIRGWPTAITKLMEDPTLGQTLNGNY